MQINKEMPLCVAFLVCLTTFSSFASLGCKEVSSTSPATQTVQPTVVPIVSLPKSSEAANSQKSTWKITRVKNPITGKESVYVEQASKKAMYNKYNSDRFEKVNLSISCNPGETPSLSLSIDGVLESDSNDHYSGDAKIDDKVLVLDWYVKSGIMVLFDDKDVVQRMQTGKTFMMSYRFYEGGTEYPEYSLTGLRTTMNKAGCPKLTD